MPISFHCGTCRRFIRVADGSEGKLTRCPECYSIVQIPFEKKTNKKANKRTSKTAQQTVPSEDPLGIEGNIQSRWDEVYGHVQPTDEPEQPGSQLANTPKEPLPEIPTQPPESAKLSPEQVEQKLVQLALATSVLLLASILSTVCIAALLGFWIYMIVTMSTYVLTPILLGFAIAAVLAMHIGTLRYLFQARFRGDYSRSVVGTALSLIPLLNLAAFFSFPFSFWSLHLLAKPQIRMYFRDEGDELDYLYQEQLERRRQRLLLVSNVLFIGCSLFAVLLTMAAWALASAMAANGIHSNYEIFALLGMTLMILLHIMTIHGLNEARTLGNDRLGVTGMVLSVLPPCNIPGIILFPLSIWGMLLIMIPEMRTQFRSHWDRITE